MSKLNLEECPSVTALFFITVAHVFQDAAQTVVRGSARVSPEEGEEQEDDVMSLCIIVIPHADLTTEELGMCRMTLPGDALYGRLRYREEGPKCFVATEVHDVEPCVPAASLDKAQV